MVLENACYILHRCFRVILIKFYATWKKVKIKFKVSKCELILSKMKNRVIVFVWSQHGGGNVEQRTMAKVPSKAL